MIPDTGTMLMFAGMPYAHVHICDHHVPLKPPNCARQNCLTLGVYLHEIL